jgi:Spy/CpxP family protein refolding chaperone
MQPLLKQLADSRKQMTTATANGAFDQARVAAIANQQSQAMAQLIVEREKTQAQIYNQVLTSEQQAKMDDLRH